MDQNIVSSVWPEWKVVSTLGQGSYGTVYEVSRDDAGFEIRAAVKVISVPLDQSSVESLRSEGLTMAETNQYYRTIVDNFVKEIQIMESFKGVQNIVSIEDYSIVEKPIGFDILIRMELLKPLNEYLTENDIEESMVLKLGIDMCSALEKCASKNIIHRDIKPENIFINAFGDFKLGDFGVAKELEDAARTLTSIGTINYMAPEVMNGGKYDQTADIYSLGLVLFRLLNRNRMPFFDLEKQLLSSEERMYANRMRMNGKEIPAPVDASPAMAAVIQKACAYRPGERFGTAHAMKLALEAVQSNKGFEPKSAGVNGTVLVNNIYVGKSDRAEISADESLEKKNVEKKKAGKPIKLVVTALVIAAVVSAVLYLYSQNVRNTGGDSAEPSTAEIKTEVVNTGVAVKEQTEESAGLTASEETEPTHEEETETEEDQAVAEPSTESEGATEEEIQAAASEEGGMVAEENADTPMPEEEAETEEDQVVAEPNTESKGATEEDIQTAESEKSGIVAGKNTGVPTYLMDVIEPYITPNPNWYSTEPVKMGGKSYEHGFSCYGYNGLDAKDEACFNLEGKYHELSCVFGIVSPSMYSHDVTFTILTDGTVAEALTLPHDALPEEITVSVEGCKQLKLVVDDESSPYPRYSGVYGVMEITIR